MNIDHEMKYFFKLTQQNTTTYLHPYVEHETWTFLIKEQRCEGLTRIDLGQGDSLKYYWK